MSKRAYLVLENGVVFTGEYFGAVGEVTGELVFTTGMTSYLETLTDLSFHGQIVLQTFPVIGNFGVIPHDFESGAIGPAAYIVKHPCKHPSNFRSEGDIGGFLKQQGIIGLCGIDTRALTGILREKGVMNARITPDEPVGNLFDDINAFKLKGAVKQVGTKEKKLYSSVANNYTVALIDAGARETVRRMLLDRLCDVWVFPPDTPSDEILSVCPDGAVIAGGPGDPSDNAELIENITSLIAAGIPLFGISLGHLLLAIANGFSARRMKLGHRGDNLPAKDRRTGAVYITSQNHGYELCPESIDGDIAGEWFVNVNDGTNEGLSYRHIPAFSVQFNPDEGGGPRGTGFVFDRFIQLMEDNKNAPR